MTSTRDVSTTTMPFGKHRGRTLYWIATNDPGYLLWTRRNVDFKSERLRDAIELVCEDIDENDLDRDDVYGREGWRWD